MMAALAILAAVAVNAYHDYRVREAVKKAAAEAAGDVVDWARGLLD